MAFPPYRRSPLRSHTYNTLVHIFSHLSAYNNSLQTSTQPLSIPDNGSDIIVQENKEKEPKSSEYFDSDFMDLKGPVRQKEIQEIQETVEGVRDKNMDFTSNALVLDDIQHLMEIEEMSIQANGFDKEQKLMDELELVVKGTEDVASKGFDMTSMLNVSTSKEGQASALVIGTSSSKPESQQKETELVKSVSVVAGSPPNTKEGEFEKEDGTGEIQKCVYHNVQDEGEKFEKLICMNNATNSSNNLIEGDMEEGEIFGELGIDGNLFDVPSEGALNLQLMEVDEVQKPENVNGNMIYPSKIENQEKEKGYESNSSLVNALQDANSSGQVELRNSGKKGIAGRAAKDHGNTTSVMMDNASDKKRRGPGSESKKVKKKIKSKKKRAEKNKELGVKRLQLQYVQKPKIVSHCRHYLHGRCHEGDKCQFSHDVVPLTKAKPCTHFARNSCMKGDNCPYDHQLSKYPCNNFVSKGSCCRGDACLFSHQVPTHKDIPTPSNVCRPELKSPLLSGNANFNTPLNNHGSSSVQQNQFTNSAGIHSSINVEHKVTDPIQKQPTPPKGISFINLSKLSPGPGTPKQGTIITTKETPIQMRIREDQSACDKTQNTVEIPKKLPAVAPKGINFLSFGKGSVCSFKSQSVAEGMKSKFPEKTSVDVFMRDHNNSKLVLEDKKPSDNSQSSDVTSATLLRPFASNQSSPGPISGYHKHASNSSQRALLSTLAFAAEHESDIKMKCPTGGSPV